MASKEDILNIVEFYNEKPGIFRLWKCLRMLDHLPDADTEASTSV
jgi:hypothetical protein